MCHVPFYGTICGMYIRNNSMKNDEGKMFLYTIRYNSEKKINRNHHMAFFLFLSSAVKSKKIKLALNDSVYF